VNEVKLLVGCSSSTTFARCFIQYVTTPDYLRIRVRSSYDVPSDICQALGGGPGRVQDGMNEAGAYTCPLLSST
jgi:hypothetical protein